VKLSMGYRAIRVFQAIAVLSLAPALACAADAFKSEVIHASGSPANRINIVIMSERFTDSHLASSLTTTTVPNSPTAATVTVPSYHEFAKKCSEYMFGVEPFKSYQDASGNPKPYYRTTFSKPGQFFEDEAEGWKRVRETRPDIRRNASAILVNEEGPQGWSNYGVGILKRKTLNDIGYVFLHELGHSWCGLADEYYDAADGWDPLPDVFRGSPNIDVHSNAASTKWGRWIGFADPGWPVNDNGSTALGAYRGGAGCKPNVDVFHSRPTCIMNVHPPPYCEICREQIVLRIHEHYNLIDRVIPPAGTAVKIPSGGSQTFQVVTQFATPEGLKAEWILDDKLNLTAKTSPYALGGANPAARSENALSTTLFAKGIGPGDHTLTVHVRDTKAGPPDDLHMPFEFTWSVTVTPPAGTAPGLVPQGP
jgi:hypothetical protein